MLNVHELGMSYEEFTEVRKFLRDANYCVPVIKKPFGFKEVLDDLESYDTGKLDEIRLREAEEGDFFMFYEHAELIKNEDFIKENVHLFYRRRIFPSDYIKLALEELGRTSYGSYRVHMYARLVKICEEYMILQFFSTRYAGSYVCIHQDWGNTVIKRINDEVKKENFRLWIGALWYKWNMCRNRPLHVNKMVDTFREVFGEENTDYIRYTDISGSHKGRKHYGTPYLTNHLIADHMLTVKFDEITVKNEKGESHTIHELYAVFFLNDQGNVSRVIKGTRMKLEYKEYLARYQFSHLAPLNLLRESFFCLGERTNISLQLEDLKNFSPSQEDFELFLYQFQEYLKWESEEGGPHRYIKNIRSAGNNSEQEEIRYSTTAKEIAENILDDLGYRHPNISVDFTGPFPSVQVASNLKESMRIARILKEEDMEYDRYIYVYSEGNYHQEMNYEKALEDYRRKIGRGEIDQCKIYFQGEWLEQEIYIDPDQYKLDQDLQWILHSTIMDAISSVLKERITESLIKQNVKNLKNNEQIQKQKKEVQDSNEELFGLVQVR